MKMRTTQLPDAAGGWRFRGVDFSVNTPDGAVLRGEQHGQGPTVVLSHCWTGDRATWAPVAQRLASDGFHVVVYDQRGHGASSLGSESSTMNRLAKDLAAVLDALDIVDAVVAGHSLGGMTAIQYAIDEAGHGIDLTTNTTKRVKGIALVATSAQPLPRFVRRLRVAKVLSAVIGSRLADKAIQSRLGGALTRSSMGKKPSQTARSQTLASLRHTPRHVRGSQLVTIGEFDALTASKSIQIPASVVVGTRDTLTPKRHAKALVRNIANATLTILPTAGHMLPLERPDAIAQAIAELRTATTPEGKPVS